MPSEDNIDSFITSKSEEEVAENFHKVCLHDPFPSIPPSLLNHTDIKKYICSAGIIYPYIPENLTGATYKVPLLGDVYYWELDDKDKFIKKHLHVNKESCNANETITLKKNSITYFHISTVFRVPYYLVFRFNLTVSLAHKGLLLGTGPIVDPGFEGRIMIPVHNLTAEDYSLDVGSGLIRIEFTKLSPNKAFDPKSRITLEGYNYQFPDAGKNWDEAKYFQNINCKKPITSSIPGSILEVKKIAKQAEDKAIQAESALSTMKRFGWIALVALLLAVIYPTYSLIKDTNSASLRLVEDNAKLKIEVKQIQKKMQILQQKVESNRKIKI